MTPTTGTVSSNGIELFYEARGPEQGEPIVFVMGLSAQMVFWPEPLLDALAEKGYRVIRFDNRDVGLSTKLRAPASHGPAPTPNLSQRTRAARPATASVRAASHHQAVCLAHTA